MGYFCEQSDGPLVEGMTVKWSWGNYVAPVKFEQIILNEKIVIEWPSMIEGTTTFEMSFSLMELT